MFLYKTSQIHCKLFVFLICLFKKCLDKNRAIKITFSIGIFVHCTCFILVPFLGRFFGFNAIGNSNFTVSWADAIIGGGGGGPANVKLAGIGGGTGGVNGDLLGTINAGDGRPAVA